MRIRLFGQALLLIIAFNLPLAMAQEKNRIDNVNPNSTTTIIIKGAQPQPRQQVARPPRIPRVGPKLTVQVPLKVEIPEMVKITGGRYNMGILQTSGDESPQHSVQVGDFEMSKTPITNKQFRQFVETAKYQTEAESNPTPLEKEQHISWRSFAANRDDYPVVWVSYNDVSAYCRWLTLVTKPRPDKQTVVVEEEDNTGANTNKDTTVEITQPYRLPTEAEWEYAARGGQESQAYVWGDKPDPQKLNANFTGDKRSNSVGDGQKYLKAVGYQEANAFGLQDLLGNTSQWCYDWYGADYYVVSPEYKPYGPEDGTEHVIRGGSWQDAPERCQVTSRHHAEAITRNAYTSFRILRAVAKNTLVIIEE